MGQMEIVIPNEEYRITFLVVKAKITSEASVESLQFMLCNKEARLIISGSNLNEKRIHTIITNAGLSAKTENVIQIVNELEKANNDMPVVVLYYLFF